MRTVANGLLVLAAIGCTGGQTGDPGVADSTSIVERNGGPGESSPVTPVVTDVIDSSGTTRVDDTLLLAIDAETLVVAEPRLGVRVIDISDPHTPYVRSRLPLAGVPIALHLAGSRLLVVERFADDLVTYADSAQPNLRSKYSGVAVSLVDIADRSAPTLLDTESVAGHVLTSHLVNEAGQAALFLVITQHTSDPGPWLTTSLRSLVVIEDELRSSAELKLSGSALVSDFRVTAARAFDKVFVVARSSGSNSNLSLVQLHADGTMLDGNHIEAPEVTAASGLQLSDATLRAFGVSQLAWYDASDATQLRSTGSCMLPSSVNNRIDPDYPGRFVADLALVESGNGNSAGVAISRDAEGRCSQVPFAGVGPGFAVAAGTGARALYLTRDVDQASPVFPPAPALLGIQQFATDQPAAAPLVSEQFSAPDIRLWRLQDTAVLATSVTARAADGSVETGLLSVPWLAQHELDELREGVDFFTFSDHTVTRRGSFAPAHGVVALSSGMLAALSQTDLTLLDISSSEDIQTVGHLPINGRFANAVPFETFTARQRSPLKVSEPVTAMDFTHPEEVELVASLDDVQPAVPESTLSVPRFTHLARSGNLLVTLSPAAEDPLSPLSGRAVLTVAVTDVSDPGQPRQRGVVSTAWPGLLSFLTDGIADVQGDKLDAMPIPNGLVVCKWSTRFTFGDHVLADDFIVIDLHDPDRPLVTRVASRGDDTVDSAFVAGSSFYYSYYHPADSAAGEHILDDSYAGDIAVQYAYRRVDVSDASHPRLVEDVKVPGKVLAVGDHGELYSYQLVSQAGEHAAWLRQLQVHGQRASVLASRNLGDVAVHSVVPDGRGNVVVDVMGRAPSATGLYGWSLWGTATRLLTFAADGLMVLGDLSIDYFSVLRTVSHGRAVLEGVQAHKGLFVVDLSTAATPRLQAFHWALTEDEGAVLFDGERILVQASAGLLAFDARAENL
jgi:hypothetical protein